MSSNDENTHLSKRRHEILQSIGAIGLGIVALTSTDQAIPLVYDTDIAKDIIIVTSQNFQKMQQDDQANFTFHYTPTIEELKKMQMTHDPLEILKPGGGHHDHDHPTMV